MPHSTTTTRLNLLTYVSIDADTPQNTRYYVSIENPAGNLVFPFRTKSAAMQAIGVICAILRHPTSLSTPIVTDPETTWTIPD